MNSLDVVLAEVAAERARQDEKWGEQNHPLVDPMLLDRPARRMAEEYEIPTPLRAIQLCQTAAERGQCTWAHILIEEVAEFVGAGLDARFDPEQARYELVQVAAVAVSAIQAIDRAAGLPS